MIGTLGKGWRLWYAGFPRKHRKRYRMDIIRKLAEELQIHPGQAKAAVELIDGGNTIPFIARYRKRRQEL